MIRAWNAFLLSSCILLVAAGFSRAGESPPAEPGTEADRLFHEGLNLLRNRSYAKAEPVFDRILERQPGNMLALYCRAVCRLGLARYGEAVADLDDFLKSKPDHAKALAQRGRAHLCLENYEKAMADLGDALRVAPGDRTWLWDLEQARMLSGGKSRFGEGKAFPDLSLKASHRTGEADPWRVMKGNLLPLLPAISRVESTWWGGGPFRGLLLLFFTSVKSPYDRARLSEVTEYLPELEKRGLAVAAVSADPPEELEKLREGKEIACPLFTDIEGRGAWQLGVLNVRLREEGRALPTVFVLDRAGKVVLRRTVLDPGRRTPIEALLKEIDAAFAKAGKRKSSSAGEDGPVDPKEPGEGEKEGTK